MVVFTIRKYDILTEIDVLSEKYLLEKVATIKSFGYLPLCSELKKPNYFIENIYEDLNSLFKSDTKEAEIKLKKRTINIKKNNHQ